MRRRLNSVRNALSPPTILVERRAFMSRKRSISWSLERNELFGGLLGLSELELVRRRELLLTRIAHRKFTGELGTT